jgi:hypothetical protein
MLSLYSTHFSAGTTLPIAFDSSHKKTTSTSIKEIPIVLDYASIFVPFYFSGHRDIPFLSPLLSPFPFITSISALRSTLPWPDPAICFSTNHETMNNHSNQQLSSQTLRLLPPERVLRIQYAAQQKVLPSSPSDTGSLPSPNPSKDLPSLSRKEVTHD